MSNEAARRPRMSDEAEIDELAMMAVKRLFLRHGGHRLEKPDPDYGRDARLIFKVKGTAKGYTTSLQVKGTRKTDTDSALGFKFELDVSNIEFLTEDVAPAYYVIHNCNSETTYIRSAHEIAQWLDACRKGWRDQKSVTVTFKVKSPLTDAEIKRIADEAHAWAAERRTTKEIVESLEASLNKYAKPKSELIEKDDGSFLWMRFRGGYRIRSVSDSLALSLFMAHLGYAYMLSHEYRRRLTKALLPSQLTTTGLGTMDLAELTKRLQSVKTRHGELEAAFAGSLNSASPEPQEVPERLPRREPGLLHPKLTDLSAEEAVKVLRPYLVSLGLTILNESTHPLEIVVACGKAKGLLSFAMFGLNADHAEYQAVRSRMVAVGANAGVAFIRLCQFEDLMLQTWPKPAQDPTPALPVGTVAPNLGEFLGILLKAAVSAKSWPASVTATPMPNAAPAFSRRMEGYLTPASPVALGTFVPPGTRRITGTKV